MGRKTNMHIMGPCWRRLNVSNVMQMRREEGRRGEERSRAEEEADGVFVCPRRLLSSHYQGIRQMLPLYRCWFDSEPPTLIPSSLLFSTTHRQRLLYASSPPLYIAPHHLQSFVKSPHTTFLTQLFNFLLLFLSHAYTLQLTRTIKKHKYYKNYLVRSQCKFVCSSISPTCAVCPCVRVLVNV